MRMAGDERLPEPPAEGAFAAEGDWAGGRSAMASGTIRVLGIFRRRRRTLEARACPNLSRPSKSPVRLSRGHRISGRMGRRSDRLDRGSGRMGVIPGGTALLSGTMGQGDLLEYCPRGILGV